MDIGVIAEDQSDVDVLYELTCKLVVASKFHFKQRLGRGCGKLQRKCSAWAVNLHKSGCRHIIVLHDLDRNKLRTLQAALDSQVRNVGFDSYLILIPIRELEAWLLADGDAIRKVFGLKSAPRLPSNPELVSDPKKTLGHLARKHGKFIYSNTVHNKRIASLTNLRTIERKCKSFESFPAYIGSVIS